MQKEYLCVGYYEDTEGQYVLKIGTTNDLERRRAEHIRNYHNASTHRMKFDGTFEYIWSLPLSKYNTLRYEDYNRQKWIDENVGVFVANDRFVMLTPPTEIKVKIRKEYTIKVS